MKLIQNTYLFFILALLILQQACTVKQAQKIDAPRQESDTNSISIQEEIDKHGTIEIEIEENGKTIKKNIIRSKVDSLTNDQLQEVNRYFRKINSEFPEKKEFVFIKYYPGKDFCNSSGIASRDHIGKSNKKLILELAKKPRVASRFIYKSPEGLDRYDKGINWISDIDQVIETSFFEYHYPCSSYVILHKSGLYYAYFGESWVEKQIFDIELFTFHF